MTPKQSWLLKRLVSPAAILPPALNYPDLNFDEQTRRKIGYHGFEYLFLLHQDPDKVNASAIGKKTFALHCPWPSLGFLSQLPKPFNNLVDRIVFGKNKISMDFPLMAQDCFDFASKIGAKIIVFHINFLDHHNLIANLKLLDTLEKQYKITAAIEQMESLKSLNRSLLGGVFYEQFEGSYDWITNPIILLKALKSFNSQKKFALCFDAAAAINLGLPLRDTVAKILDNIVHFHLSENEQNGEDWPTDIKTERFIHLLDFLYDHNYNGLINAEVIGIQSQKEHLIAQIYGASSVLGLPILKSQTIQNAQSHIQNSANYLLSHI